MKKWMTVAGLMLVGVAQAATYQLPDPTIFVNPNYNNNTTIVTVNGITYRGASQFVYFSECAKPDGVRYHCNIMVESNVPLVALDGTVAMVNLTVQFASTLITSGHNWWRHSQTVLAGDVTTP